MKIKTNWTGGEGESNILLCWSSTAILDLYHRIMLYYRGMYRLAIVYSDTYSMIITQTHSFVSQLLWMKDPSIYQLQQIYMENIKKANNKC